MAPGSNLWRAQPTIKTGEITMTVSISNTADMFEFFQDAAGLKNAAGNPRHKHIVLRILQETARLIEELDISDDEFWAGVEYINRLGKSNEAGLLVAGLGVEHFLDLLNDAREAEAGRTGGTPRTIEGPLYVAGAPLSQGYARMDDGSEDDVAIPMFVEGRILDLQGQPIAGALVDLWQADSKGNYSHFDKSQSAFNLRRRIVTDTQGRYRVRSIVPSGYGCNPEGPTQECLNHLGRHGQRPAHIHFFVSASGYEHLTTQINLSNDKYLWDDFAYATRDGLIGEVQFIDDEASASAHAVPGRFAHMTFDFQLRPAASTQAQQRSKRPRALQDA
jgi:catechol 1,2-dioxygenase